MVASEICKKYNESNNKREMIKVLADMESCTKEDIIELLVHNGCEIVRETRGRKAKASVVEQVKEPMPDIVREALAEKMDKIDQRIKELEPVKRELEELEKKYKQLANYLCKEEIYEFNN